MLSGRATGALAGLRAAVIAMAVAAIVGGLLLPVYTDEIGWRFQERAGFDGVDKMFSELCGANTLARPPFFMWPARAYSAVFNALFPSPLWIRLAGILYALAWLALVLALVRRLVTDRHDRLVLGTVALGLMGLGLSPLLAVWSRPEQPIVLAATCALWIAASEAPAFAHMTVARSAWLRSLAIAALAAVATSYHVKGLFVVPLMLACLIFASRGRAAHVPRMVAAALIVVITAMAASYWKHRLSCPGNPALAAEYARNSISGKLADIGSIEDVRTALGQVIANISLLDYIALASPRPTHLSNWLEPGQIAADAGLRWLFALVAVWGMALMTAAAVLVGALVRAVAARRIEPRIVLSIMLLLTVLGWSSTQLIRNVYEETFVLPLTALAVTLALSTRTRESLRPLLTGLAVMVGLAALTSQILVARIYGPSLWRASAQSGLLLAQPVSVSPFHYGAVRRDVLAAARLCRIDPQKSRALMLDDATYFPFIRSYLPQHQLGVLGTWSGGTTDPVAYLKSRRSSGTVVTCTTLPPALRARAKTVGRYCCVGPREW